ncbi:hypothetical protein FXO38_20876 [Capsicum annuum]|nr:hypothetical protein FXO38_20876 [Capsicum annuum]
MPDENEIKSAIFDMSPDSAAGPDDLNGKLFLNKIPIVKTANALTDKCKYCTNPQHETMSLVFMKDDTAQEVWNNTPRNKIRDILIKIIPIVIIWEIWKGFSTYKYGGQIQMWYSKVIYHIEKTISNMLCKLVPKVDNNMPWSRLCELIEKIRPILKWRVVCWRKSSRGRIRINTNGSYLQDTTKAGNGGIIRDENGDVIIAFAVTVKSNNNNMIEILAANYGVELCLSLASLKWI